jgi:hypothetical protein
LKPASKYSIRFLVVKNRSGISLPFLSMAENFSISERASMTPLGFDSPPPLVMTTVPLPPGMDASFLPEPQ